MRDLLLWINPSRDLMRSGLEPGNWEKSLRQRQEGSCWRAAGRGSQTLHASRPLCSQRSFPSSQKSALPSDGRASGPQMSPPHTPCPQENPALYHPQNCLWTSPNLPSPWEPGQCGSPPFSLMRKWRLHQPKTTWIQPLPPPRSVTLIEQGLSLSLLIRITDSAAQCQAHGTHPINTGQGYCPSPKARK